MGNQIKRPKASLYHIKGYPSNSKNQKENPTEKHPGSKMEYRPHLDPKMERLIEIPLEQALKKFPQRWKSFCFGSVLAMNIRYRNLEIVLVEFENMINSITKNIRALHIKPTGTMVFEPKTIYNFTDKDLIAYGTKLSRHLFTLQKFTISGLFNSTQGISFNAIESFVQNIARNLSHIQKLTLNLAGETMDDKIVKMLARELTKGLSKLQSIEILLDAKSSITNNGLKCLLSGLNRYSTQLTELELFCYNNVNDERLAVIGDCFHRNLRNLKNFVLKIHNLNVSVTDKGLETIGTSISKYLVNLEHLTLWFLNMNQITDKGAEIMLTKICSTVNNLKSISLSFSSCSNITASTFKMIFTTISQTQKDLIALSLNFRDNKTIDKSTFRFLKSINKKWLKNREYLCFNFTWCDNIEDEALTILSDWILKRLPKLKTLLLNLLECNISNQCEARADIKLSKIPKMEMLVRVQY